MRKTLMCMAVSLAATALGGCDIGLSTSVTASPTPSLGPSPLAISDRYNGQTLSVHVGQRVQVELASTLWTFQASSDLSVLREVGNPTFNSGTGPCPPGQGCGTVTALFEATAPGRALIVATRTSCGEAERCLPAEGRYQVTVVVAR